jgi:hypothetical protein
MNFNDINQIALEVVDSFASMEAHTKWDQLLQMQNQLADTPIGSLLSTPEYITVMFAGQIRFNNTNYVTRLRNSLSWPASHNQLEQALEDMLNQRVAQISRSRQPKWQEIKENHPAHAAMVIFVTESLASNPTTSTFLNNLLQQ